MEENERRNSKESTGNMMSKTHEVKMETEKLVTISDEVSDVTSPGYLPSYNSIDKYMDQFSIRTDFILGDSPIPIPTLEREPASRYGNHPQEEEFVFSADELELEPMTSHYSDLTETPGSQKSSTVIGNSKVKPNNQAFNKAIGFLLETKNEKRQKVIKRVKFTK